MNLRWLERNGEKVLQYSINYTNHCSDGTVRLGVNWEDVPTHKEPEKKVEITEKQLEEIFKKHEENRIKNIDLNILYAIKKALGFI